MEVLILGLGGTTTIKPNPGERLIIHNLSGRHFNGTATRVEIRGPDANIRGYLAYIDANFPDNMIFGPEIAWAPTVDVTVIAIASPLQLPVEISGNEGEYLQIQGDPNAWCRLRVQRTIDPGPVATPTPTTRPPPRYGGWQ
jgi:hypothetical protein